MPIYEYKCQDCGENSEFRIISQAQAPALTCKSCGSRKLNKLMSVPVISSGKSVTSGQTCCGRNERCSDAGSCCGH
jgi:putative FmdB family regulatory protein